MVHDVDVVHIQDVHAIRPEPLQRELEASHDPVVAVVVDLAAGGHLEPFVGAGPHGRLARLEQPSHLRGEEVAVPIPSAQEGAEAAFGKTEPVERGGVVVANPALPGPFEDGAGIVVADRPVEVPEGGGAEAELGEVEGMAVSPLPSAVRQVHALKSRFETEMIGRRPARRTDFGGARREGKR